jgi:hypothetical protein
MSVSITDIPISLPFSQQVPLSSVLSTFTNFLCTGLPHHPGTTPGEIPLARCSHPHPRRRQPLPLPNPQTLDTLSLLELENAVWRVHRLIKNLQPERPRPVRLSTFAVKSGAKIHSRSQPYRDSSKRWRQLLGHSHLPTCGIPRNPGFSSRNRSMYGDRGKGTLRCLRIVCLAQTA